MYPYIKGISPKYEDLIVSDSLLILSSLKHTQKEMLGRMFELLCYIQKKWIDVYSVKLKGYTII